MASVIVVGRTKRRAHALEDAVTVVGRDAGANLELGDLQISRRHALLIRASQGFFVKDLGSRNGVLLNDVRVPSRQQACLQDGDVLSLGRTTLIFKEIVEAADLVVPASEQASEPAEAPEEVPTKTPLSVSPAQLRARPPGSPSARTPLTVDPVERAPRPSHPEPLHRTPMSVPAAREKPSPPAPRRQPSSSGGHRKPSAEALTLHALIERTERDRQFFRNVSMILFCFLLVTLILVFAWALFQRNATPPTQQPQTVQQAPAPSEPKPEVALDAAAFARDVQPLLASKCAGCHSQPDRGGNLRLASAQDAATSAGNLAALAAFVTPQDLVRSPLLLKPLAIAEGGVEHGGGDVLTVEDPEWIALREWVTSARSGAQTPLARILAPRQAALGHPLAFNAEAQAARGGSLAFRWTLLETPADSRADLREVSGSRTRLTPDVAGRYVVELQVREGSAVASTTHSVEVGQASQSAPPAPRSATASSQDAKPAQPRIVGSDLSAVFRRCLGREPSQEESQRFATAGPDALQRFLLGQDALYARWWGQELDHLGLVGQHAPRDEPWTSLPRQLRQGRFSVADVHYALLVGQFWSERYPEPQASARAMVEKILGPSASDDAGLLREAVSLLEGHEVTFLGSKVRGQVGLVRSLVRSKRAAATLLQRTHFRLRGRNLTKPELAKALEAYQADPRSYFTAYLNWATSE